MTCAFLLISQHAGIASAAPRSEGFIVTVTNNDQPAHASAPGPDTQPPPREATFAEGREEAAKTGAHSYVSPAEATVRQQIEELGSANNSKRVAQQDPPQPIIDTCRNDPRADGGKGHVFHRLWWCQEHGFTARATDTNGNLLGEASVNYIAIAWGSYTSRDILVELQKTTLGKPTGVFSDPDAVRFIIGANCADTGTGNGCAVHYPTVNKTLTEWGNDQEWHNWLITSDESKSTSPDLVLRHRWNLSASVEVPGGTGGPYPSPTPYHLIRCDSATYFAGRPKACINDEVLPYITYEINSAQAISVHDVAVHIREAQDTPDLTFPPSPTPKRIPGKYIYENPKDNGLRRIPEADEGPNRAVVRQACNQLRPIPSDEQCDEYPFAATMEGAASPDWDFSAKAVNGRENTRAGGYLRWYVFWDRMLYRDMDSYYVNIID